MQEKQEKLFVISLGGSIMVPDEIDEQFLKKFKAFILRKVATGYKFIIITGGGKTCRKYNKAAFNVAKASQLQQDWLGIEVTKLNALLLKTILGNKANPIILDKRGKVKSFGKEPIIIGCGWEPGCSTDLDTVQIALDFNIKNIVNLSNQDYVYTADPEKIKSAKPLKSLTWQEFFKVSPKKRTPGMNTPFDPTASKLAQKNGLRVIMANGKNLANLEKIMAGKLFIGTIIH
ncbi:MAG: UMP kinase [Candidatus Pacebacteria bacterium]|nr:UMP kinase [Candidatus Paceibacterota bacterium]